MMLVLFERNIGYPSFKAFVMNMISAIEKPNKPSLRLIKKTSEFFVDEVPDLFYIGNNYKEQKKDPGNRREPEPEIGLPPQPKEYLKYPDYDWF